MDVTNSLKAVLDRVRAGQDRPGDVELLLALAQQAIESAGAWPGEREAPLTTADVLSLMEAVATISSFLEVEPALQGTSEQLARVLDMPACAISQWDPEKDTLRLWVHHSPPEWPVNPKWCQPIDLAEFPLTRRVLERGEIVQMHINDADLDPAECQFMREEGLKTLFLMPLVAQDRTIGLVELMDNRGTRRFSQVEISLGKLLANHAGIVIERAILLEATQQRAAELEAVRQATLSLTASLDLPEVLDEILKTTMALIPGSHNADIFLYQADELTFGAAIWQDGHRNQPFAAPREHGLTRTVARTGDMIVVEDMTTHPLFMDAPDDWGGSIVGLPLKIGERLVGVMNVANDEPHAFTPGKLHILRLLGDQAAIAIENARLHNLVRQQARTDLITGLFNRRALDRRLEEEVGRSDRYERPFSLLMLDLDDFKAVNDTYGHPMGDQVLEQVAACLQKLVRETDFLARFGGDEFAVVLPETDLATSRTIARRLLESLAACPFDLPEDSQVFLTASLGIATYPDHASTATALMVVADQALYQAKKEGPGCVTTALMQAV